MEPKIVITERALDALRKHSDNHNAWADLLFDLDALARRADMFGIENCRKQVGELEDSIRINFRW